MPGVWLIKVEGEFFARESRKQLIHVLISIVESLCHLTDMSS